MPFSAFVTQEYATKLFGNTNPFGKTIWLKKKWVDNEYTITGILKNIPQTSIPDLQPDIITTTFPFLGWTDPNYAWEVWHSRPNRLPQTYVLLKPNAVPSELEQKLPDFAQRHLEEEVAKTNNYILTPLTHIYLHAQPEMNLYTNESTRGLLGNIQTCYTFGIIGIFIVLVACINFMNLSTARSSRRMREVGMRKVVGAKRTQIILQFLGESVLIAMLALILALGLTELSLPFFNSYLNRQLALSLSLIPVIFTLAVGVGILAGSYPAFYLSSFRPSAVLKVMRNTKGGQATIRKGLVVVQFAISMILLTGTLVIFQQAAYMRSANMGFNKDALIKTGLVIENAEAMKSQFLQHAGVKHVTKTHLPLGTEPANEAIEVNTKEGDTTTRLNFLHVDPDFLKTFEIPLLEGRDLTLQDWIPRDMGEEGKPLRILLNQTAAQMLGAKPNDLLYSTVGPFTYEVVGIFSDFHRTSLQHAIAPLFVRLLRPNHKQNFIATRVNMQNLPDVLAHLEKVWKTFNPNRPFEFAFMNDAIDQFYRAEQKQSQMFALSSGLAILIACLGLLGLIAYTAEVRTKEIGIRKVLGATEMSIVSLLTKEFLVLVGFASLLAWPIAYYTMSEWLQNFAYRIELSPSYFIASTGVALVITLITIAYQAMKAARANPIEALRYE
jgi:putative ABC transport system permease protein